MLQFACILSWMVLTICSRVSWSCVSPLRALHCRPTLNTRRHIVVIVLLTMAWYTTWGGAGGNTMKSVNMGYKNKSTLRRGPDIQKPPALASHTPATRPEPLWPVGSFHRDCSLQWSEVEEDADSHNDHTTRYWKPQPDSANHLPSKPARCCYTACGRKPSVLPAICPSPQACDNNIYIIFNIFETQARPFVTLPPLYHKIISSIILQWWWLY